MRAGRTLGRLYRRAKPLSPVLPALFFVTDPWRIPHPVRLAKRAPRGLGVIYRGFGQAKAARTAQKLAQVAARRGLTLLIGAGEPRLATAGVHLPERLAAKARRFRRRPKLAITAAAHGKAAIRRARLAGCDAVLVSAVFKSASPSAGRPLGVVRFAALVRDAGLPVYALGGIDGKTARRLIGSGAAGLAAVDAFSSL